MDPTTVPSTHGNHPSPSLDEAHPSKSTNVHQVVRIAGTALGESDLQTTDLGHQPPDPSTFATGGAGLSGLALIGLVELPPSGPPPGFGRGGREGAVDWSMDPRGPGGRSGDAGSRDAEEGGVGAASRSRSGSRSGSMDGHRDDGRGSGEAFHEIESPPQQIEPLDPKFGRWKAAAHRSASGVGHNMGWVTEPGQATEAHDHTFRIAKALPVEPSSERRLTTTTDVSTFDALSGAISSDAENINIVSNISFTAPITISGKTNLNISSSNGAVLSSDRSFTANNGGMFYIESSSDVKFTNLLFVSGSAYHKGGAIAAYQSNVELADVHFTSCTTGTYDTYNGGGAIHFEQSTGTISQASFTSCSANNANAGAVLLYQSTVSVSKATFTACSSW